MIRVPGIKWNNIKFNKKLKQISSVHRNDNEIQDITHLILHSISLVRWNGFPTISVENWWYELSELLPSEDRGRSIGACAN